MLNQNTHPIHDTAIRGNESITAEYWVRQIRKQLKLEANIDWSTQMKFKYIEADGENSHKLPVPSGIRWAVVSNAYA